MHPRSPASPRVSAPSVARAFRFGALVSASSHMREVFDLASELAGCSIPVVIEGEAGTGKELLAREMHRRAPELGPFVVFDRLRHAGEAIATRLARALDDADGGTLYLEEVTDLPVDRLVELLASEDPTRCRDAAPTAPRRARILAATRADPGGTSPIGRVRDQLSRALAWVPIRLPPLRARPEDVGLLATHFLARAAFRDRRAPLRLSSCALAALEARSFPGNVRELEELLARAARGASGPALVAADLARADARPRPASRAPGA